jgi:probable LLM family oxidoreductase
MEVGIDSFAARMSGDKLHLTDDTTYIANLLERIQHADEAGLDFFGIGEHHREGFLDSAPEVLLAAAAARTRKIRLGSAVTVLSVNDPVRVFQQFATLDLVSAGRAEIVAGRGSFIDAYPLFGFKLEDYDALFAEKLELLLKIRDEQVITWSGKFRPALHQQPIFPRPHQERLPIWLGVGGTPQSFVRAGLLGLPLMVAVIGGETHRFKPLIDLYREAGRKAGHPEENLKVGLHSLGYVGATDEEAVRDFYPGYAAAMTRIGNERGWPPMTFDRFLSQMGDQGALLVGSPENVAAKILRHSEAWGGISRITFQLDTAELAHEKLMETISLIGDRVQPVLQNK